MTKQLACWKCSGQLSVTPSMIGSQVGCPHCNAPVLVPGELYDAPLAQQIIPPAAVATASVRTETTTVVGTPSKESSGLFNAMIVLASISLFFDLLGVMAGGDEVIDILCALVAVTAGIIWLIFHYRLWAKIPSEYAETTPGKAVGYILIPFFNFWWIFKSCVGVQRCLNVYASSRGLEPIAKSSLATAYSVFFIVEIVMPILFMVGIEDDADAKSGAALVIFLLSSVPSFVVWLLMVLNQRQATAMFTATK